MNVAKTGNNKVPGARATSGRADTAEATELAQALDALEVSEAGYPAREETHRLRRDVIAASVALERKQAGRARVR